MVGEERNERQQPEQTEREGALREALQNALRNALREVETGTCSSSRDPRCAANRDRERRRWLGRELKAEQLEFMHGITVTATLLWQARETNGDPVYPTDARYNLLAALGRIEGWPSIADLARVLRVSKQAAREHVIEAAQAGLLELLPDPHDRRSIQVGLTASGKRLLGATSAAQYHLVTRLLNGLEARDMRLVTHVLRVIRERLLASRKRGG